MLRNFSFVIKDRLAGCAAPGTWSSLEGDLEELKEQGITALVSLTEEPLDAREVRKAGFDYLHEPIPDFNPPTLKQIRRFVDFVQGRLAKKGGGRVAVHCFAGRGRTGTMLASYLVATGITADEAIRTIRRLRPGSVETREQERAVSAFQAWLQEMGKWKVEKKARKEKRRPEAAAKGKEGKKEKPAPRAAKKKELSSSRAANSAKSGSGKRRGKRPRKSKRSTKPPTPADLFDDMT